MVIEIKIKLNQINQTVDWLSKDSGVSKRMINYIIRGDREASRETIVKISESLNVAIRNFNKTFKTKVKEVEILEHEKHEVKFRKVYRLK